MKFNERLKELRNEIERIKMLATKMKAADDCVYFWKYGGRESVEQIVRLSIFFDVSTDCLSGKSDY